MIYRLNLNFQLDSKDTLLKKVVEQAFQKKFILFHGDIDIQLFESINFKKEVRFQKSDT